VNIIGVCVWYQESASWLSTCIAGAGRFCDTIICVDGSYALYPAGRARSHPEESEAIIHAAEAAGCGLILHRPKEVWWGNEVEKRNHSLDLARAIGAEGEDWVVVFDSDNLVMQAYPDVIRQQLEATDLDVATYTILDGKDMMANGDSAKLAQEIDVSLEWTVRIRGVYRLLPDLRYQTKHWYVKGTNSEGRDVFLFGPSLEEEPACQLEKALVFYHRRQARPVVRLRAADEYSQIRDKAGVEKLESEKEAVAV
jgi:hypothetical protein